MEITANQKYIGSSPRKLRLVADLIRKMDPQKALLTLKFTQKVAAKDLEKAIKTALANAKQAGLDNTALTFSKIEVNEGMKMRRYRAGTRGRVKPYKKRMSHIKIVLTDSLIPNLNLKTSLNEISKEQKKEVTGETKARVAKSSRDTESVAKAKENA